MRSQIQQSAKVIGRMKARQDHRICRRDRQQNRLASDNRQDVLKDRNLARLMKKRAMKTV